jgi:sugar phosphate isomerase/epimerase
MTLTRRNFFKASLGSAAVASLAACTGNGSAGGNKYVPFNPEAKLNISFQESTLNSGDREVRWSLKEKLDIMERLGVTGLEPGGGGLANRVDEFKQALSGRNIKISAICAGFRGFMLAEDEEIRDRCRDTMREIIVAAGALGSTGVIIVPAFNSQKPVMPHTQATRDFLCQWFDELGKFAVENGTTVILEPLRRNEAFYLRQVSDAANLCRDINNPGVTCMGDFWHMTQEDVSDMGAFLSAGKYLQHVHIASRARRRIPSSDGEADNYVDGFRGLKIIGYDKYVSYEGGSGNEELLKTSVELLRKQWDEA